MDSSITVLIIVGAVVLAISYFARKGRAAKLETRRQEAFRESQTILKDLNRSLGFPEGQGPTGVMLGGEYHVVNVGHTERMKSDPVYVFGNKMAGMLLDMQNLESALKEAEASGDASLVSKIKNELASLGNEAEAYMDEYQRTKQKS